jgi:hypothetical protein
MHEATYGVNAITVGGAELLLAVASSGSAVHLARLAEAGAVGQSAVPDYCFTAEAARHRPALANYDSDALRAPRWHCHKVKIFYATLGRFDETMLIV